MGSDQFSKFTDAVFANEAITVLSDLLRGAAQQTMWSVTFEDDKFTLYKNLDWIAFVHIKPLPQRFWKN